jgi:LPXTG-motif cell wall-anchored protein
VIRFGALTQEEVNALMTGQAYDRNINRTTAPKGSIFVNTVYADGKALIIGGQKVVSTAPAPKKKDSDFSFWLFGAGALALIGGAFVFLKRKNR